VENQIQDRYLSIRMSCLTEQLFSNNPKYWRSYNVNCI